MFFLRLPAYLSVEVLDLVWSLEVALRPGLCFLPMKRLSLSRFSATY
jgi:hypothetical protein